MDIRMMVPRWMGEKIRAALGARIYENRGGGDRVRVYLAASPDTLRRLADLMESGQ